MAQEAVEYDELVCRVEDLERKMKGQLQHTAQIPARQMGGGGGLPPGGLKYQVLQRIDDVRTAGWDWVRAH